MRMLHFMTLLAVVVAQVLAEEGQINFNSAAVNAPVYDVDCQTLLEGPAYLAQLYYGQSANSLSPVGRVAEFGTRHRTGYFFGGAVSIQEGGIPALFQVRAWETSAGRTYEEAVAAGGKHGISNVFPVIPAIPTWPPSDLVGLQSFCLVPEPSPVALGLLGMAALWSGGRRRPRRRQKRCPQELDMQSP